MDFVIRQAAQRVPISLFILPSLDAVDQTELCVLAQTISTTNSSYAKLFLRLVLDTLELESVSTPNLNCG